MKHLNKSTRAFLESCTGSEGIAKKIKYLESPFWIPHPAANMIYKRMEEIFTHPRTHRMPDLLIVAKTNNGKSSLLERFQKNHKAVVNEGNGTLTAEVISFVAPYLPTEGLFLSELLKAVSIRSKNSETVLAKLDQTYHVLNELNTKVILIDEIQHLGAASPKQQRLIQNMIKNFSTILKLSFIAAGTPEALNIFSADEQLSNRFKPAIIPRWSNDDEFKKLLISFESVLPFEEPSNLHSPAICGYIATKTDGTIGDTYELLQRASIAAIKSGKTKISKEDLETCGHLSPADIQNERTKNF